MKCVLILMTGCLVGGIVAVVGGPNGLRLLSPDSANTLFNLSVIVIPLLAMFLVLARILTHAVFANPMVTIIVTAGGFLLYMCVFQTDYMIDHYGICLAPIAMLLILAQGLWAAIRRFFQ